MIPTDLASRLRLLIAATVRPPEAIAHIPDNLLEESATDTFDLRSGQRFAAQIQAPLPDGTFRAQVAQHSLRLALSFPARAGDLLELEAVDTQDGVVHARLADADDAVARPTISPAGRMIGQLLAGRWGPPQPVQLSRGEPMLPSPPRAGAELAPVLRQAVTQSGLFYESHQAQWLKGELPLPSLLQEPQAQEGLRQLATHATPEHLQRLPDQVRDALLAMRQRDPETGTATQAQRPAAEALRDATDSLQAAARETLAVPDRLMPVVHQQLESMATHHFAWQGQVWPGQTMQWDLYEPGERDAGNTQDEDIHGWRSTLRLSLVRLGGVEARITWTPNGVSIRVEAAEADTANTLRAGQEKLADAMAAAGVPLNSLSVAHHAVG